MKQILFLLAFFCATSASAQIPVSLIRGLDAHIEDVVNDMGLGGGGGGSQTLDQTLTQGATSTQAATFGPLTSYASTSGTNAAFTVSDANGSVGSSFDFICRPCATNGKRTRFLQDANGLNIFRMNDPGGTDNTIPGGFTTPDFSINKATGNVGIGLAAAAYKLEVNGYSYTTHLIVESKIRTVNLLPEFADDAAAAAGTVAVGEFYFRTGFGVWQRRS